MTYLFQTLEKTAVNTVRGVKPLQKKIPPTINKQHVPEHQSTVAGKLRECQALGPRVNLLENKLKQPPAADNQANKTNTSSLEKVEMAQKINNKRTEELKVKQQLVDKQRKQKELTRLKFYLNEEEKKEQIIISKGTTKLQEHKKQKVEELFQKQEVTKEFRQRQMQKIADVKAIQAYKSKKIVDDRKQQKEYEKMLEVELDEELKQLKQREKELQQYANMRVFLNSDGSLNESMKMEQENRQQQQQSFQQTKKPQNVQIMQKTRACDILRAQMIQERMK